MTEEERPEAKEQEACFAAIREIVQEISRLMDAAYQQYSRLVEQVLNGRITEEREMILLVTPAEKRAAIMQAIMEKAGAQSEAQSVVFSVALDEVVGLYSVES